MNSSIHFPLVFLNLFWLTHFCKEAKAGEVNAVLSAARAFIEHPVPPSAWRACLCLGRLQLPNRFCFLHDSSHWYTGSHQGFWLLVRRCDMQATPWGFPSFISKIEQLSFGIIVLNSLVLYSNKSKEYAKACELPNIPFFWRPSLTVHFAPCTFLCIFFLKFL